MHILLLVEGLVVHKEASPFHMFLTGMPFIPEPLVVVAHQIFYSVAFSIICAVIVLSTLGVVLLRKVLHRCSCPICAKHYHLLKRLGAGMCPCLCDTIIHCRAKPLSDVTCTFPCAALASFSHEVTG